MKKRIISAGLLLSVVGTVQAQERQVVDTVASALETQGLMTPKGRFEIEPSFSYSQNTSNRISILGFTQVPALLVGIIEAEDADLTTFTWALAARYGLTNRIELELRVPVVYRHDSITKRIPGSGSNGDETTTLTPSGGGLGDVEAAVRYQFNLESIPFWIGGLRVKSDTGESPFDQTLDVNGIFTDPPTGSGAWSLEPSLTMIYPLDPAVLFATGGYTWNMEADAGVDIDSSNGSAGNDKYDLGDSFFLGMGMGFAVNNRLSFSLGFNHRTVFESSVNGNKSGEVLQLDSLTTGFSLAINDKTSVNMSLQAGLTEDAPDVQLNFGMPIMF
ncbi:transporter [Oceanisphaera sp. KMM 10153]|uniref:transporter n=1 Tax=Oceanisphaera submarina TaxID=3390193 RepID=UPI003976E73A